jgi:ABC-type Zn2+ transport system substrate-binding protein/surface adhesin
VTLIKPSEKERHGHNHHHHHHHDHSNDGKVFLHIEKSRDVCNTFQRELVGGIMKLKQAQVKFLEAVRRSK